MRLTIIGLALLGYSGVASSSTFMFDDIQDVDPAKQDGKWRATAELGVLLRSGNTDSRSWKGKLDIQRDTEYWRNRAVFDYYLQERKNFEGETVTDADRLFISGQGNRKFNLGSHSSIFLYGSYEDDALNSFEYQSTVAAGYGARVELNESMFTDFEIGPGYAYDKRRNTGETDGSFIVRAAANYDWQISETARFTQLVSTEVGNDNTRSRAVSALTSNLNSRLALRLTLTLTHNSTVYEQANGRIPEKLDTETAVTLVYTF
ncbi:putative salt-induced outer membrane protein [Idiomarina sp. A28L]|uniref:DUF481 domain-containing protein n=1 Tax=Idiomarina sp. A28L TaxID=1036674 RepID=UPI00021386EB|nr:DUF481 domain-containing protein [Idiomarina sp. A28L]EGN75246.1 putative salt-induced outer membrane protein [Idiomarina sp. A28L]